MTSSSRLPEDAVAIAVMAKDITYVKGTTEAIEKKLDKWIDKADFKFESFGKTIIESCKRLDATETGIRGLHKRASEISNDARADLNSHEQNCIAREVSVQKLSKNSRAPKDTPKHVKQPDIFGNGGTGVIPKWLYWTAAMIGIAFATFFITYMNLVGTFGGQ